MEGGRGSQRGRWGGGKRGTEGGGGVRESQIVGRGGRMGKRKQNHG